MTAVPSPIVEAILSRPAHMLYPEEQFVPVEEYLTSAYRPDMDYVDGHLEVRNLGEYEHGKLQGALLFLFSVNEEAWGIRVVPECRLQVKAESFRVPDLLVLSSADEKPVRIVRTPPLLCIEILSRDDTFARIQHRVKDYIEMGVENVWLLDPKDLDRVYVYRDGTQHWLADRVLTVTGTPIRIDVDELQVRASRRDRLFTKCKGPPRRAFALTKQ